MWEACTHLTTSLMAVLGRALEPEVFSRLLQRLTTPLRMVKSSGTPAETGAHRELLLRSSTKNNTSSVAAPLEPFELLDTELVKAMVAKVMAHNRRTWLVKGPGHPSEKTKKRHI